MQLCEAEKKIRLKFFISNYLQMSLFLEIVFLFKYIFCSFPDKFQVIMGNRSNNMPSLKGALTILITVTQLDLRTAGILLSILNYTTFY